MKTYDRSCMRPAFTMIELIFVMVIIGILAAIAFPRLAATRDDAAIVIDITNMRLCLSDAASKYMATGTDLASGDSSTCDKVKCYTITYATNGTNFTVATNPGGADYCSNINALGGHLAKTYQFKGTGISI